MSEPGCGICRRCVASEEYKLACGHLAHTDCVLEIFQNTGIAKCQKCLKPIDLNLFRYNNVHTQNFFRCADYAERLKRLAENNFINAHLLFPDMKSCDQRRSCIYYYGIFVNRMTHIYNSYYHSLRLSEMKDTYDSLIRTSSEAPPCFLSSATDAPPESSSRV